MRPVLYSGSDVTDRETWNLAVDALTAEHAALSPPRKASVTALVEAIKGVKEALHGIAEGVSVGEICAACGGECCRSGKYHVTVVDILVYLAEGREMFTPGFGPGRCPYLGGRGCLMAPPYRPFKCITFNCERVESLLGPQDKERSACLERELRALYGRFEGEFGNRFMGGLLQNYDRDVLQGRGAILGRPCKERKGDFHGCNRRSGSRPHRP